MAITECPMPLLPSITLLGKVIARTGEKATAFLRKTVGTRHFSPVGGCIAGEYWGGYSNQSSQYWCREGESNPQDPKVGGF